MKKFILTAIGFFFIIGIMASCSGSGNSECTKTIDQETTELTTGRTKSGNVFNTGRYFSSK